jgi:hypothetical protein
VVWVTDEEGNPEEEVFHYIIFGDEKDEILLDDYASIGSK